MGEYPNDINKFKAEDFQRYYNGTMPAQERHALEKAALDDPFLADALAGYAYTTTAAEDMLLLNSRLEEKIEKEKTITVSFKRKRLIQTLSIAALLLIMIGAGLFMYNSSDKLKNKDVAINTNEKVTIKQPPVSDTYPETTSNDDKTGFGTYGQPNQNKAMPQPRKEEVTALQRRNTTQSDDVNTQEVLSKPNEVNRLFSKSIVPDKTFPDSANNKYEKQVPDLALRKPFKAKVVDKQNKPIPYATVKANNSRIATTTDKEGSFSISSPDSTLNATVDAVGFQSNKVMLKPSDRDQKIVMLEADASLNEVVVTGYGTDRKTKTATQKNELKPVKGWSHFNNYIAQKLQSVKIENKDSVNGSVQLSFEADNKGRPVNIKVEKSLSENYNAEAIRLLVEGPDWKQKKGKRGLVTIQFK